MLFLATLGDVLLIAWALLRWVDHLNDFGRMSDIIDRIETAATRAARIYRTHPSLGAVPGGLDVPVVAQLHASLSGYVRHIDLASLQKAAERHDLRIEIRRTPGKYVHKAEALLRLSRAVDPALAQSLTAAFTIGTQRSFDQDVRYGLIILAEVASKALSPGINDPGTAIEVLRAGGRVFEALHDPEPGTITPPPALTACMSRR